MFLFQVYERGTFLGKSSKLIFNKLTSVFVWIHEAQPSGSAYYFDNVMTKFMINNRTDALKTDVHLFFTITTGQNDQA